MNTTADTLAATGKPGKATRPAATLTGPCPAWCQHHYPNAYDGVTHTAVFGIFHVSQDTSPDSVEQALVTMRTQYAYPETVSELHQAVSDFQTALTACMTLPPVNSRAFTLTLTDQLGDWELPNSSDGVKHVRP